MQGLEEGFVAGQVFSLIDDKPHRRVMERSLVGYVRVPKLDICASKRTILLRCSG